MVCPYCESKTEVTNSRHQKRLNQVWRRRRCLNCGATISTHEQAAYESVWRVRNSKSSLIPFNKQKLFVELYKACEHRPTALDDAIALTDTVIGRLLSQTASGLLESKDIATATHKVLKNFDTPAAVYYAARYL